MTTSDVLVNSKLAARRSNDALATTIGAVPIGFSLWRMTATDLLQYSYSPSGELTMATYADGTKAVSSLRQGGQSVVMIPTRSYASILKEVDIEKSGEWTFKYDKDGTNS